MAEMRGRWKRLSSKTVHQNPYYSVREDSVIKPDGSSGFYNLVEGRDAVFVIALDKQQNMYLVELHRYTNNNSSIEIPAGGIDGQDPLVAAKRELHEETGLSAQKWQSLGFVHPASGIMSSKNHIFLATDLKQSEVSQQLEEGITKVLKIPLKEVLQMVKDGKITDSESISALALAALHLDIII